jgi:hypothetical protein
VDDEQADGPVAEQRLQPAEVLDVDLVRVPPRVAACADALERVDRDEPRVGVGVEPVDELRLESLAEPARRPADLEAALGAPDVGVEPARSGVIGADLWATPPRSVDAPFVELHERHSTDVLAMSNGAPPAVSGTT